MSKRGFASMTLERRKEVAALGGLSAHRSGKAYKFNSITGKAAAKIAVKRRKEVRKANMALQSTGQLPNAAQ